ncbi:MAG: methyltransferase domain-containing protein [Acidiferrobacterales bacterium]|nr:methyltransferase domain-containing protein [Acidiferrobacterales bacterium]
MLDSALTHLRSPVDNQTSLDLEVYEKEGSHIVEGLLTDRVNDVWFPIVRGVPVFLMGELKPDFSAFLDKHKLSQRLGVETKAIKTEEQKEQSKTNKTFSDKWTRFQEYGLSPTHQEFLYDWYCKKFAVDSVEKLRALFASKSRILECGPGSGFNSRFMAENTDGEVYALDVSDAAFTTYGNTNHLSNCYAIQADLFDGPFENNSFDLIVADGVLHHTPDTKKAVFRLYEKLAPGGNFFFYIYRQMGAARKFCDAHIRDAFMHLEPEDCYKACESLTDLGKALADLGAKITLDKPVEVLGIPAGTHDVQRLFYYNFVKCFWNDAFDYETNNMVNFDWYHPHNAWQHTEEEVVGWMEELAVSKFQFNDSNPNGISCFLTK